MIRMILKQFKRDNTYIILPLLFIICTFFSCHGVEKHNGFRLNEFAIDDVRLRAIVDSMVEMHLPVLQSEKEKKIISLNFSRKDSVLYFVFSLRDEEELIVKYIYRENKRIVGYTNSRNIEVILLSDIDDLSEFGKQYERFIHPTKNSKAFNYMKFPENLYIRDDSNTWPDFELLYDPTYIVYPYVNNSFLQPVMTKDPDFSYIPLQDFSKPWTDEKLYKKYKLTDEEIQFIESIIKPME